VSWRSAPQARLPQGVRAIRRIRTQDPWEPFNRVVFQFNDDFDNAFLKPVAKGYQAITPAPVDRGITNFFENLADVRNTVNNALQFKMARAATSVGRIVVNSTLGVLASSTWRRT